MNAAAVDRVKENVQPLRSGRKPQQITQVLSTPQTQHRSDLDTHIDEFEQRIISSSQAGSQELFQVYLDYIHYLEAHLVTGDQKHVLLKVYERCTQQLQDEPRLKNDTKFVRLWVKYADMAMDPLDIFAYMETKGIGVQLAALYALWALAAEKNQLYKKSDEVFLLGLRRLPPPEASALKGHYLEFQKRMALPERVGQNLSAEENRPRAALAPRAAGSSSLSQQRPSSSSVLSQVNGIAPRPSTVPQRAPSFDVFQDPASSLSFPSLVRQTASRTASSAQPNTLSLAGPRVLGGESERRKENTALPSKWSDAAWPVNEAALLASRRSNTSAPSSDNFVVFNDSNPNTNSHRHKSSDLPSSSYLPSSSTFSSLPLSTPKSAAKASILSSPDQRENKVREDLQEDGSRRFQFSEYDRLHAWTSDGQEVSFEELRAMKRHGYRDIQLANGLGLVSSLASQNEQNRIPLRVPIAPPVSLSSTSFTSSNFNALTNPRPILRHSRESENAIPSIKHVQPNSHSSHFEHEPRQPLAGSLTKEIEVEDFEKTRNFTLSGNMTVNTRQALNSFLSMANKEPSELTGMIGNDTRGYSTATFDFAAFLGQIQEEEKLQRHDNGDDENEIFQEPSIASLPLVQIFEDDGGNSEDKENQDKEAKFPLPTRLLKPSSVFRPLGTLETETDDENPNQFVETTNPEKPLLAELERDAELGGAPPHDFFVFEEGSRESEESKGKDSSSESALPHAQSFLSDAADSFLNALNDATRPINESDMRLPIQQRNLAPALAAAVNADPTSTITVQLAKSQIPFSRPEPTPMPFVFETLTTFSAGSLDPYLAISSAQSELVDVLLTQDTHYAVVDYSDERAPPVSALSRLREAYPIGGDRYFVVEALAQGSCVLQSDKDAKSKITLRLYSSASQAAWAWYSVNQLRSRLPGSDHALVSEPQMLHVYSDVGFVLESFDPTCSRNLKELRDAHVRKAQLFPEELCVYYVREVVRALETLHSHDFVHAHLGSSMLRPRRSLFDAYAQHQNAGNLDSDGFDATLALRAMSSAPALVIDGWNLALDLRAFPEGVRFSSSQPGAQLSPVATRVLGKDSWAHGVDFLGLADVAHYLLHGTPLTATFDARLQRWQPVLPLKAFWQKDLWGKLFDECLNVHSRIVRREDSLASLASLRGTLEEWLRANPRKLKALKLSFAKQFALLDSK